MGAGPEGDYRFTGQIEVGELPHLIIWPVTKPQLDDAEVGFLERLHSRLIGLAIGIDKALCIDREEDGAREAMPGCKNLGKLGQALFRPVFLVAGQKDDLFPFARTRLTFVDNPRIALAEN
jgi:hypothetical protein